MKKHLPCAFLFALAVAADARAGNDAASVCGRAAVLQQVAALLRQAGRPLELERLSVGEDSVRADRVVACAVRGHMPAYDTNRFGKQPIDEIFVVNYTLELRRNGIFIRLQ